jgi:putative endopeptidase
MRGSRIPPRPRPEIGRRPPASRRTGGGRRWRAAAFVAAGPALVAVASGPRRGPRTFGALRETRSNAPEDRMNRTLLLSALAAALVAAPVHAQHRSGVNRALMDTTVAPCSNFYLYANGRWQTETVIPEGYASIGAGREMFDRNQVTLARVLQDAAEGAATAKDPDVRKLGHLYAVLADSVRAERDGMAPLASRLERIEAIRTRDDVRQVIAAHLREGLPAPIAIQVGADEKNSRVNLAQLWQSGFGLPERDFYFRTDAKSDSIRREYVAIMTGMLAKSGVPVARAASDAEAVMRMETALAESSLTRTQMRDPHALYHKMSVRELAAVAPSIAWTALFGEAGAAGLATPAAEVNVSMPGHVRALNTLIANAPIETWRAYLRWSLLRGSFAWLDAGWLAEGMKLQKLLQGIGTPIARWKRAASTVDAVMGEAVGKAFVATEFNPESKRRMDAMVANLRAVLRERIANRTWMSAETRTRAIAKLDAMLPKIGYPDRWRDYSKLDVDPKWSAYENLRRAQAFEVARQYAKLGKPVDRAEWLMSPATVNAYYNPTTNEITFPAGILQPPRFDATVDDAWNYGAIGMVIGHELTHGFDDEGRKYDADGNLADWWTADDARYFTTEADKVVRQYSSYAGIDTLKLNGRMTLGENIADIGGLTIAYHAWKRSLGGRPAPVIDGFTGEQRFFLGHAQTWRNKMRDQALRTYVLTNEHSPGYWRVNGALSVMPEFAEAFGCAPGTEMVREERPQIW